MKLIDAVKFQTSALRDYDQFFLEASLKIHEQSAIALMIWSDVLKELGSRGEVTLTAGSYDDIGNALIARNY